MHRQHAGRFDDRPVPRLGFGAALGINPHGIQPVTRVTSGHTIQRSGVRTGRNGHQFSGMNFTTPHGFTPQADAILAWPQSLIVSNTDPRQDQPKFSGNSIALLPNAHHDGAIGPRQTKQCRPQINLQFRNLGQTLGSHRLTGRCFLRSGLLGRALGLHLGITPSPCHKTKTQSAGQQRNRGQRCHGQQPKECRNEQQSLRAGDQLLRDAVTDCAFVAAPRDQHACGGRNQKGWYLCGQTITNGQARKRRSRLGKSPALQPNADQNATHQVDSSDDQARDGIAAHKLGSTIHRPVEVSLGGDFATTTRGFLLVDQARRQICIDGHLFPGHGIEREPRRDFTHSGRTLGDHDKLHDDQDRKDDEPNDQ